MRKLAGCIAGSCPSVHKIGDGKLLIVGERAPMLQEIAIVGKDEAAIIVDAELILQAMRARAAQWLDDPKHVAFALPIVDAAPNPYDPLTPDMPHKPDVSDL